MDIFARIAEERILDAMREGAFDGLPGSGRPLCLDDESGVPEDLRLINRVLKNAGFLPPEIELRQEIVNLRALMETLDDDRERLSRLREINFKLLRFNVAREGSGRRPLSLEDFPEYEEKLGSRLMGL